MHKMPRGFSTRSVTYNSTEENISIWKIYVCLKIKRKGDEK
jgi:hypothetical protein